MTYTTTAATLDPLTHCARMGIKPTLYSNQSCCYQILNPLHHSGELLGLFFFFFFFLFRATPEAYGSTQADLELTAAGPHHRPSKASSGLNLRATSQLMATLDTYPLSEAMDQTHILMGTTWVCNPLSTMGTPPVCYNNVCAVHYDLKIPLN